MLANWKRTCFVDQNTERTEEQEKSLHEHERHHEEEQDGAAEEDVEEEGIHVEVHILDETATACRGST